MKVNFKFSNGDQVAEKITGFKGTITGAVCYLTGCNQYLVTAKAESEVKQAETLWYDEGRLELIKKESVKSNEVIGDKNGADISAPIK